MRLKNLTMKEIVGLDIVGRYIDLMVTGKIRCCVELGSNITLLVRMIQLKNFNSRIYAF